MTTILKISAATLAVTAFLMCVVIDFLEFRHQASLSNRIEIIPMLFLVVALVLFGLGQSDEYARKEARRNLGWWALVVALVLLFMWWNPPHWYQWNTFHFSSGGLVVTFLLNYVFVIGVIVYFARAWLRERRKQSAKRTPPLDT